MLSLRKVLQLSLIAGSVVAQVSTPDAVDDLVLGAVRDLISLSEDIKAGPAALDAVFDGFNVVDAKAKVASDAIIGGVGWDEGYQRIQFSQHAYNLELGLMMNNNELVSRADLIRESGQVAGLRNHLSSTKSAAIDFLNTGIDNGSPDVQWYQVSNSIDRITTDFDETLKAFA